MGLGGMASVFLSLASEVGLQCLGYDVIAVAFALRNYLKTKIRRALGDWVTLGDSSPNPLMQLSQDRMRAASSFEIVSKCQRRREGHRSDIADVPSPRPPS